MRRAILVAAAWCASSACGAPPLHVVRGEAFATGNATFDDFFTSVRDLRAEAIAAPDDEEAAHSALVKALGLEPSAKAAAALDETAARAKKLQGKGVLLHLEIAPEPKLLHGKADPGPDGEALVKAVESTAKTSLETSKRLIGVAAHAATLEQRRVELRDQAAAAFHDGPPSKRDEIMRELDAAKTVLADAGEGATRSAGAASRFVVGLVQAVETGGGAAADTKPARGKKGAGGMIAPKGAGAAPPTTPAPPKKKPKGGDDFEP